MSLIPLLLLAASIQATPQESVFRLSGVRAPAPPVIDGALDEEAWEIAARATDFIQFEPQRGEASQHRSEVLVMYDSTAVYVAFRLWDSQPLTAQLTRRDAELINDDAVYVILDTHHDRQSAYFFGLNPLGTQEDGRIANDGRTMDNTWDEVWHSAAQRTEWGWTAEIAIPLSSIRYGVGEDMTWGANFGRVRRRTLETSFWSGPLENLGRVSQAGTLEGLDLPRQLRRSYAIVYGLSRLQEGESPFWDAGGDLRLTPAPEWSIHATVNPDFATIEADQEQINLTRFELSLPEKRPFFLEGSEMYRQRIRTFYSRRISDITGGARVVGRSGGWSLGYLSALSEPSNGEEKGLYNVARVQRDLGRSNIGMVWADRRLEGDHQGSVSLDATLFFTPTLGMTAQFANSYGPSDSGTGAFFIRPSYDSPTGHFHVRYTYLGERFADNANVIGFIRDDNRRELDSAISKTLWFRTGALERLSYRSNYNIYWGVDDTLRSWKIDESLAFEFRSLWSASLSHTEEFKKFEKDFRNRETGLAIGYNTRSYQSLRAGYRFVKNFDSDFQLVTGSASYKVTPELSVEYELQRLLLDPDPDDETTWIHVARASHFFTNDLFIRLFFQTNSAIDRRNLQAVFVWRYLPPFGTIQIAFQRGTAEFGLPSEQGNTLFIKATRVF